MMGIKKVRKVGPHVRPCFGLFKLPTGPGQCVGNVLGKKLEESLKWSSY